MCSQGDKDLLFSVLRLNLHFCVGGGWSAWVMLRDTRTCPHRALSLGSLMVLGHQSKRHLESNMCVFFPDSPTPWKGEASNCTLYPLAGALEKARLLSWLSLFCIYCLWFLCGTFKISVFTKLVATGSLDLNHILLSFLRHICFICRLAHSSHPFSWTMTTMQQMPKKDIRKELEHLIKWSVRFTVEKEEQNYCFANIQEGSALLGQWGKVFSS